MDWRGILYVGFRWILILLVVLIVCPAHAGDETRYGGEYRAPLMSEPATLDPAYYTDIYSMSVAANLFDGLVEFDRDLNVVPAIAKRWKISRDYRTYTFQLRKGVQFHNGREVTAGDFVFSFSRILSPNIQSPVASLFLDIQGARAYHEGKSPLVSGLRAPDPYTLQIQLEEPFAPFLSILAMVNAKVVPQEAMDPNFGKHPIGTGPFRFRAWEPEKAIVLEANTSYFEGRPFFDSLYFRIYRNIEWEKIFEDFSNGLLEHALIPSEQYEQVQAVVANNRSYRIASKPGLNLVYLGMNTTVPPFDDLRVRQAFNYAVDTMTIVNQITKRGSIPMHGILPPGIAGFDPSFKGYSYDPQKALKLLKQAGYPEGKGFPTIEVWTVSKAKSVYKELQAYQQYLAKDGIKLIIRIAENWQEYMKNISENKAPLFYAAWYADYPDPDNFFYPLFYSESKINRTHFQDLQVDQLLQEARKETDYIKRVELYREIQKLIINKAPIIPQHVNSNNYLFRSWIHGAELSYLGIIYLPYRHMWFDHQKLISNLSDVLNLNNVTIDSRNEQ